MKTPEQIAHDSAADIMQSCNYSRDLNGNDVKQIILAAIHEASRVTWTKEPPTVPGLWQHRFSDEHGTVGRNVLLRDGVLCCEFGGELEAVDAIGGEWSDKPIQEQIDE